MGDTISSSWPALPPITRWVGLRSTATTTSTSSTTATVRRRLDVVVTDPRLHLHVLRASDGVGVSRGQRPGLDPGPDSWLETSESISDLEDCTVPVGTTYSVQPVVESADIVCPGDRISETLTGASPMRRMDPVDADADGNHGRHLCKCSIHVTDEAVRRHRVSSWTCRTPGLTDDAGRWE